jgi:hypothetical protein
VLITTLVCAAILVMGPYVIRAINAYFKTLEEDIQYSLTEPITQGPPTGYQFPTCSCPPALAFVGCGNGAACPRREEIWGRTCDPIGCETQFYRGLIMQECRDNPLDRFPTAKCCEDPFYTGNCGNNAVNVAGGGCPQGEGEVGQRCGSDGGAVVVTDYWCDGIRNEACIYSCVPEGTPVDGPPGTPPPKDPDSEWCDPDTVDPAWPNQIGLIADWTTVSVSSGGCTGRPCESECQPPTFKMGISACDVCPAGYVMQWECGAGYCDQGPCGPGECRRW